LSRAGLAEDPSVMRAVVDDARAQLSSALAELRQLARGIHPAALTQGGLRAGLLSLASRTARVELSFGPGLENDVRFPTAVESTAYFVVAEAVTNALKYGGSGPIKVEVEHSADGLIVAVADDGPGDARIVAGGGLAGLLDRVRALGGALDLHTRSSGGIRVEARLPLTEAVA
jgi:signal transduction histidine kinase